MQITTILAFITAMGGLEAVKWIVRYISCRKTDARKEEASVCNLEEENRRKKVDWLEDRLTQRAASSAFNVIPFPHFSRFGEKLRMSYFGSLPFHEIRLISFV